ncbi:MAG: hypothetical protein RE469_06895 [Cuniculiplasma divulgatum]|jgi:phosphoglycerol transferase MdoB-like AlkP superfamily enzyme|nr:MAG: hypothetical protein RE469_06895 [Cuniculiplasma divulgatum]
MIIVTYGIILLTVFIYLYFLIFALAEDNSWKYIRKAIVIPTVVMLSCLGGSLTAVYLTKPSLANIIGWSPLGISLIVMLLSCFIWWPLSLWSIQRLTFPIFQSKYGLEKSDFRDFASMNIFNKKKKLERWQDRNSRASFDFKK